MAKFYAVIKGRQPGIYETWDECKAQTSGYSNAQFKSYKTLEDAKEAFGDQSIPGLKRHAGPVKTTSPFVEKSISVDASCSGNPGAMEYQAVVTGNGLKLFNSKVYPVGTNNLGEFLAIVDAMKYLINEGYDYPIYSDSLTAMAWVRNKKVRTNLEHNEHTKELHDDVRDAVKFLKKNTYKADIRKWDTKSWGESKADFDRK